MKLTGEEDANLCAEKNGKPHFNICQLNWHQLLNDFISDIVCHKSKSNKTIEKFDTRYITINNLRLPKDATIEAKFIVWTKEIPQTVLNNNLKISIKIKDFYNRIIELFIDLAKQYNTTIWNIGLDLIGLELTEGKPVTKIKIYSSNNSNIKEYMDVISKYSMDDITLRKEEKSCQYYIDIYVDSLDFLPKLYQELLTVRKNIDGIIFGIIEDWYYKLEIYDGYRE